MITSELASDLHRVSKNVPTYFLFSVGQIQTDFDNNW